MPVLLKQIRATPLDPGTAHPSLRWYFVFLVVSGFCGLVYEVVWLRLAMASFGVTTALASIVLSTFMAGLGLGSWGAGLLTHRLVRDTGAAHCASMPLPNVSSASRHSLFLSSSNSDGTSCRTWEVSEHGRLRATTCWQAFGSRSH